MRKTFVLIVEDDIELGDITSTVLQHSGMDTEVVRDGGLAFDRIKATSPDVILLDVHLPNVSGTSILNQIKADPRFNQTKVIMTTADALIAQTVEDKADLVLIKPISFPHILNLTSKLVSRS